MSGHGIGCSHHFLVVSFISLLALATASSAGAAIDTAAPELAESGWSLPESAEIELSSERWQRFLASARDRYQAMAEKAAWLERPLADDCADPQLSLAERYDCLRSDVFARSALEASGMTAAEHAAVLHQTVGRSSAHAASTQQRRQFLRLQAEWWPTPTPSLLPMSSSP